MGLLVSKTNSTKHLQELLENYPANETPNEEPSGYRQNNTSRGLMEKMSNYPLMLSFKK